MAPTRVKANEIWLGTVDTDDENGYYKVDRVTFAQLGQFIRKLTIGDATKDSDDYISSWVLGDFSGGGQIEEYNEGAETARFWTAVADTRSPNTITLPPLVSATRPNANCSICYPLGAANDGWFYAVFLESSDYKIFPYNESTDAWGSGVAFGTSPGHVPVNKAVYFNSRLFVPCGANGYKYVTGSAGTPTVTTVTGAADAADDTTHTSPRVKAFAVFDQVLYALTQTGAVCWSDTGDNNDWQWYYDSARSRMPKIDGGLTPKNLIPFLDKSGVPSLFVFSNRGGYLFDPDVPMLHDTPLQFPRHPDFARGVAVWRPGEDLWVSAGLDVIRYTNANVVVPFSGLARDDGLPQGNRGAIVDLEPEVSGLYALVGGVSDTSTAYAYDSKFGADGSGDGQLSAPGQIARDSSGNIYVADTANNRLQKFNSSGVFQSKVTGLTGITGVCVDASDNVYICNGNNIAKYNSSLVLQDDNAVGGGASLGHLATDGTSVFATDLANHRIVKGSCATIAPFTTWGSSGTGNGQFSTPIGIAYNALSGYVYVADRGNDRVQYFSTAGVFQGKWGASGTGNGQFTFLHGLAVHPSSGNVYTLDQTSATGVQEFTSGGAYLRRFAAAGSGNGQLDLDGGYEGLVVDASSNVWVADTQDPGDDRIQKFTQSSTTSSITTNSSLHLFTGVGWHGLWQASDTSEPTWMVVSDVTAGYRLWWGMSDGYAYTTKLRRTLHNPRQGFQAGTDEFAAGSDTIGHVITGWFDAGMEGFRKIASHMIVDMDNASDDETLTVSYAIDGGGFTTLGVVSSVGQTVLPFNEVSGFSEGQEFNTIRLKFAFARGSTTTRTPVLRTATLHFTKVPQNTTSFEFDIPLVKYKARAAATIYNDLTALVEYPRLLKLIHRRDSEDSDGNSVSATYRVLTAGISGEMHTGEDMTGRVSLNLIAIPAELP